MKQTPLASVLGGGGGHVGGTPDYLHPWPHQPLGPVGPSDGGPGVNRCAQQPFLTFPNFEGVFANPSQPCTTTDTYKNGEEPNVACGDKKA